MMQYVIGSLAAHIEPQRISFFLAFLNSFYRRNSGIPLLAIYNSVKTFMKRPERGHHNTFL